MGILKYPATIQKEFQCTKRSLCHANISRIHRCDVSHRRNSHPCGRQNREKSAHSPTRSGYAARTALCAGRQAATVRESLSRAFGKFAAHRSACPGPKQRGFSLSGVPSPIEVLLVGSPQGCFFLGCSPFMAVLGLFQ
jgi:hypothetical protein